MIRIGILGATGYTALELMKLLVRHPQARLSVLTSRQGGNPHVASVHPQLARLVDLPLEDLSPAEVAARADCVFSCLPHGASAAVIPELLYAGCRVIDFSADYRLNSPEVYREWYGEDHPDAPRLGTVLYGLPELFSEGYAEARLIANPGCYPTSVILALAPLLMARIIQPRDVIVDSKSGVSGAGRNPKLTTHYPECNESIAAYNVGRHRHTPEIEQILGMTAGERVEVIFTPHLTPMDRGILTTAYALPAVEVSDERLLALYRDFYKDAPFVRVSERLPATKDVAGTNFCDLTARVVRGRVVAISCIDNLIKGASGAAMQNFNLMYGFSETTGF